VVVQFEIVAALPAGLCHAQLSPDFIGVLPVPEHGHGTLIGDVRANGKLDQRK
jgi:hypothetical protein